MSCLHETFGNGRTLCIFDKLTRPDNKNCMKRFLSHFKEPLGLQFMSLDSSLLSFLQDRISKLPETQSRNISFKYAFRKIASRYLNVISNFKMTFELRIIIKYMHLSIFTSYTCAMNYNCTFIPCSHVLHILERHFIS